MERTVLMRSAAVAVSALLAIACGGESPTSSTGGGVAVDGVVMGDSASASAADTRSTVAAQAKKITVKVDGSTTLSVDVNANGTFHLSGIPGGTFTLVFLSDLAEIGRVVVTAGDGSDVNIVVRVRGNELVVVEIKVQDGSNNGSNQGSNGSCAGVNGGTVGQRIELEGNVESGSSAAFKLSVNGRSGFPIDVNASAASFKCVGGAKATSDAECKASVQAGAKVHVSGTLMACSASAASVTASEVKVQKD